MTNWLVAPFGWEIYSVFKSRLLYKIINNLFILKNILFFIKNIGVMAEWLSRGTVNTFFRGSIPLNAFKLKKYF